MTTEPADLESDTPRPAAVGSASHETSSGLPLRFDTGLTRGRPGVCLATSPGRVAQEMLRARDLAVVYTPSFWWVIMSVIHLLPDRAFERLSL